MTSFDAIVIGGGHNGLACATLLAGKGRKVLVLEAASQAGGAARADEFAPGFRTSLAPLLNRLHGETVAALDLKAHGLDLSGDDLPTAVLAPGRDPLVLRGAYGETLEGAGSDDIAWQDLRARLMRFAGILRPFLFRPPPDLGGGTLAEKAALGGAALALRRLGREDMRDFLRLMLTNVADVADEYLTDDRLKGLLAFDAVLGSRLGPRSPTSLMGLYYRLAGDLDGRQGAQCLPRGGMAAVVSAMSRAAEKAGVVLRRNARVGRIEVVDGRATGVVLADGEEIAASVVVSAANARTTLLELVGPRHLDTGFATRLRHVRMTGHVARLDLALDGVPAFAGLSAADHRARIVVAPSVDHVERAFNPVKYDEMPDRPVMEIVMPSVADPSLAPEGAAVLSAIIQFVPVEPKQGWSLARAPLQANVMAQLEALAPGIGGIVRHARLTTPQDMAQSHLMPGGHWHHGELQVDQMLVNRPVFGAARYDTPIDGLFLAGAGSHPGGGVSGAPGINAARRIIAMEKRS